MSEKHDNAGSNGYGPPKPGVFDDDRLLAYALGLDDDLELEEEAAGDAELAGRLEAVRGDVALIERQVAAVAPAPADDYADLSVERWAGLREYLEPLPEKATRRRSRWLRVAVPVAAACALAALVGLVALRQGGDLTGSRSSSVNGAMKATAPEAADGVTTMSFADQVEDFKVVVLAKAEEVRGALQRFAVVRELKGHVPDSISVRVGDTPALLHRLHLLLLDPNAEALREQEYGTPLGSDAGRSDDLGIWSAKGPSDAPGRAVPATYAFAGEPALARELPAGTDPDSVTLP